MEEGEANIEERRTFINDALARLDRRPAEFETIARELLCEPEAKHRRLRSYAKINIEDVEVFSELLKQEFPEMVYFFANYKTGTPTPSKFSNDYPITLHGDLFQAVIAALDVERAKPAFNGPNFNRPNIYCRWPWPFELRSDDPERLIGGRDVPSDVFRLALQYRDEGRWFSFRYREEGYVDPRQPDLRYRMSVLDRSQLATATYLDMTVLSGAESEFFALYDLNDPETTAFAKRAHALWRRVSTKSVAAYDPVAGVIVEPEGWQGKHWRLVGKRALEGALEVPARYADFAFRPSAGFFGDFPVVPKSKGPALMIGPKLRKTKVTRPSKKD